MRPPKFPFSPINQPISDNCSKSRSKIREILIRNSPEGFTQKQKWVKTKENGKYARKDDREMHGKMRREQKGKEDLRENGKTNARTGEINLIWMI
jgi:hypothetical protein